jgi:hypothetical protein
MRTLQAAWEWFRVTSRQLGLIRRLGEKYWASLPWDGPFGRDHRLGGVEPSDVIAEADVALGPLDDLAIVVMFSVFEATVRSAVLGAIAAEAPGLVHPTLRLAAEEARRAVEEGSFFRVLEPFKSEGGADLVEEVNQVRRYRNWVAHGRRGKQPGNVDPETAYRRLQAFLDVLLPSAAPP